MGEAMSCTDPKDKGEIEVDTKEVEKQNA